MDFVMLRMLVEISKHRDGISTRRLLAATGANEHHRVLRAAADQGYVNRDRVRKPKGQKGNCLMINFLTPKGEEAVKTCKALGLLV